MTNKDKFLKDGVSVEELAQELEQAIYKRTGYDLSKAFVDFFNKKIPTLTEDERIILKNIPVQEKYIMRDSAGQLWTGRNPIYRLEQFEHLFQFIKVGEEYSIEELLGDEK